MLIRKLFKFEGAHIVRDCTSIRCKESLHGHSYVVEIKLESDKMDNGQMVVDFGLLKGTIKEVIDSFDHAYSYWDKESKEFEDFIHKFSSRYVKMPVSPSAEMYSLMFYAIIDEIIKKTEFSNGERNVNLHSVRVHETATGWAESFEEDYIDLWVRGGLDLKEIHFSDGIKDEWKDPLMWEKIIDPDYIFVNPKIDLKYNK